MEDDSLGTSISQFRTSRIQPIILITIAVAMAGLTVWLWLTLGANIGTPVAIVCVPASLVFLVWGYRLAVCVLEIRDRGVRLRFPTRTVDIPFAELESVGIRRRTVRGLPGSANGIWLRRRDGSMIIFPIESNVEQACSEINRQIAQKPVDQ